MVNTKGKLLALVAVFAAIGLVTATGAFTTVSAERTATVGVAGDDNALLALDEGVASDGGVSANADDYIDTENGQLQIDLAGSDAGASGINLRADTDVKNLFTISNQGTQPVAVYVTPEDDEGNGDADNVYFYTDSFQSESGNNALPDLGPEVDGHEGASGPSNEVITGSGNAVVLEPGETIEVSMYVDLMQSDGSAVSISGGDVLDTVTITADADAVDSAYDPASGDISSPQNTD